MLYFLIEMRFPEAVMRIDKYLADMGVGTRSQIKKEIKAGRVTIDGITVRDPGCKVNTGSHVEFDGSPVEYEEYVYYMLNKPAGVISASEDPREDTVVDLIDEVKRRDLFPAGRLDRDTEGLLLITNDGSLAHHLLSPKHHVDKTYFARVLEEVTEEDVLSFRDGLVLLDGLECMPAELEITRHCTASDIADEGISRISLADDPEAPVTEVLITIREGKFHQIKRMFQAIGSEVIYLKRLSFGTLQLDPELETGEYRRLTDEEISALREL